MFMFEKAVVGGRRYWTWILCLLTVIGLGFLSYLRQLDTGLGITGLSRDVTWGLYIAQFTFLVGVAASAVMVVLPYYLHNYKAFGRSQSWVSSWRSPLSPCACSSFLSTWVSLGAF